MKYFTELSETRYLGQGLHEELSKIILSYADPKTSKNLRLTDKTCSQLIHNVRQKNGSYNSLVCMTLIRLEKIFAGRFNGEYASEAVLALTKSFDSYNDLDPSIMDEVIIKICQEFLLNIEAPLN